MKRLFSFLDEHILSVIASVLLVFVPLYPKLPLFDVLPGYIVRVRIEDVLIAVAFLIYGIQVARRRAPFWKTPLTLPMLLYILIGALSLLSAIVITHTIPAEAIHIKKGLLHFARRIEYFSLFFIFFASVKSLKQTKFYAFLYLLTIAGVTVYGYGQKYLYWPAFSTMNREFSKGWRLYLTEHARVISTFGGHYDLAAFTMVALTFLWSLFVGLRRKLSKIIIFALLAASFWLIILTASRVSFIAYLIALTVVFFIWMFRKGPKWAFSRWFAATALSILFMLSFGDLSDRFLTLVKLNDRFDGIHRLLFQPIGTPPEHASPIDDILAQVTSKSDNPPSTIKPGGRPSDVTEDVPTYMNITNADGTVVAVPVKRSFSPNALKFDLSTSIRLDVLWPRAWEGFLKNPLLGSGYSTLTKEQVTDFTEAESTDNGYLRALGETGSLGTIAFFAIIVTIFLRSWWALSGARDPIFFALLVGGMASIVGLLVNTMYIDIFEASKVALPFWSLSGILLGTIEAEKKRIETEREPLKVNFNVRQNVHKAVKFLKSDLFFLLFLLIVSFTLRVHRFREPLADWHSWRQADTSAVSRNFLRYGINLLYPTYDDLSSTASGLPNPRGLRMVEFPLYNAATTIVKNLVPEISIEEAGRLTSILTSLGTLVFLFLLLRKYANRRVAFLTGFFYAIIPYNIFYSRVVLPEPSLVFASTAMIYFFDRFLDKEAKRRPQKILFYILALLFSISALLIKPSGAFLFLPVVYLVIKNTGWKGLLRPYCIIFFIASFIPLFWWRQWISQFPEGIPAYTWLFNGDGIRFKGAFFFWIFADRIGRLILGYWGLPLLFLGIIAKVRSKSGWFFHVWLVAILAYLATFATGNVRHDYYQILTVPILAIFLALGSEALFTLSGEEWNKRIAHGMWTIAVVFMFMFGWYHIRDFFNINHREIVEAGSEADRLLRGHALVIAPYNGDTAFLYQTNRSGWPIMEGTIEDMIKKGADYYITVGDDELSRKLIKEASRTDAFKKPYKLIKKTSTYAIIQLVPDKDLP